MFSISLERARLQPRRKCTDATGALALEVTCRKTTTAFQMKINATKQATAVHATMQAINTLFVGFRHISFCGSRTDKSA
jgi:hypothetical protein